MNHLTPRRGAPQATATTVSMVALLAFYACAPSDADPGGDGDAASAAAAARAEAAAPAAALPPGAQAVGFDGQPLFAPTLPTELRAQRERELAEALGDLERAPGDADALIWVGRRLAYLGDYRGAIERFSQGVRMHPDDPRFFRHRGHRFVTVREPDRAVADFERAVELIRGTPDEVEPDGLPNPLGIPTSTLHFNIWYHLGLAHYLGGNFEAALEAYRACLDVSDHPDSVVATSHWLYMTLRRLGRDAEAEAVLEGIHADMDIIESGAYLNLLLLHRGERSPDDVVPAGAESLQNVTAAYGIGNWHLYNGRTDEAFEVFRRIMTEEDQWAAFGYIAAEAELARPGGGER